MRAGSVRSRAARRILGWRLGDAAATIDAGILSLKRPQHDPASGRGSVVSRKGRLLSQLHVAAAQRGRPAARACAAAVAGHPASREVGTSLLGQAGRLHCLPRLTLRPRERRQGVAFLPTQHRAFKALEIAMADSQDLGRTFDFSEDLSRVLPNLERINYDLAHFSSEIWCVLRLRFGATDMFN
eukprot:scaffold16299_cov56-Isochrysis_galbana.AAC.1